MNALSRKTRLVFGVVTSRPQNHELTRRLMMHAKRTGRTMYAYHPDVLKSIDPWKQQLVNAREYLPSTRKWRSVRAPLPDVILRDLRSTDRVGPDKGRLQHLAVSLNPLRAIQLVKDKYAFSQVMQDAGIAHPPTEQYSPSALARILDAHGAAFIKDRGGSRGDSILRVESLGDDRHRVEVQRKSKKRAYDVDSEGLSRIVQRLMRGFKVKDPEKYVVQPEVHSSTYQGRKFSIRILMHRTSDGHLVTGGMARVAAHPGLFLDNIHQGAHPHAYTTVMRRVFGNDYASVHREMVLQCRKAFQAVERETQRQSSLPVGELGFDILFDGIHPVILEANSRPDVAPTEPYFRSYKENVFRAGESAYRRALQRSVP